MIQRKQKRLSIAILLVIASIITIAFIAIASSRKVNAVSSQIKYTKDILLKLNDLYNCVISHAGVVRDYSITGSPEDIQEIESSSSLLLSKLNDLKVSIKNTPGEKQQADSLEKYIRKRIEHSRQVADEGKQNGLQAASILYQQGAGREYNNIIFTFINEIQATELDRLELNEQKNTTTGNNLFFYMAGLLLFLLLLLLFIVQSIRLNIANRKKTESQLKQFNESLEKQVKIKTVEMTESRERLAISEKNLKQVLSVTAENYYVVDKNYCIILINETAQRNLLKAWKQPVAAGTCIRDFLPDEKTEPARHSFEIAFSGKQTGYELQLSVPGLPEWVMLSFIPVFDDANTVSEVCVMTKDISRTKKAEEEKAQVNYLLNERVKELTTVHLVSQLIESGNKSVEVLLNEIVSILPPGWQFPEITVARITWGQKTFISPGYIDTPYKQSAAFSSLEGKDGMIEIVYLVEKPVADEGPFLAEERSMLNTLAEIIKTYLNRRYAEEKLQQSYKEIRQLASYIEKAREDEKIKIAREIHDDLGQQLTGIKMDLSWLTSKINPSEEKLHAKLKEMKGLVDDTVRSIRRIASELRPDILDNFGLVPAIEWQSSEFTKRSGIKTEFHATTEKLEVGDNISTGLFRIFQESLTNVARHAEASLVTASLSVKNHELLLTIADNGVGFDISAIGHKRTLGLLGMKERAVLMGGKYVIDSTSGKGTRVSISVPLVNE